ncbi:MAG: carboxypeptidase regulatory-like domain-containing protein [Ferruginibacter sp.]
MNNVQDSKLNMYATVLQQFTGESGTALVSRKGDASALSKVIEALAGKVEAIQTMQRLQFAVTKGITQDKQAFRANLADAAASLAAGVFAYAFNTQNNTLKEKVNYSVSDLNRLKDDLLPAAVKNIIEVANEQLSTLDEYGISAATIQSVQDMLNQFLSLAQSPRDAVGKRISYRKNLEQLFKETDDIVKNRFDKIMQTMALTDPEAVNYYRSNRSIVSAPTTHTQLQGKIVSADAPDGVKNVSIQLVETGVSKLTTNTGDFIFKDITTGTYTLKLSAEGYQDTLLTQVEIKKGRRNKQEIILLKKTA